MKSTRGRPPGRSHNTYHMGKFITYDWPSIEAALEAGDNAPKEERAALKKLFDDYGQRKYQEKLKSDRIAKLRAKMDAEPNTPVYYTGSTKALWASQVKCMLKSKDGRTKMAVMVQDKAGKWLTWRIPYDSITLDWRGQTAKIHDNGAFNMAFRVDAQPW